MPRGEPLDGLTRELDVTAAALTTSREQFLAGGHARSRRRTDRDDEIQRRRANALLLELPPDGGRTCL